MRRNDVVNNTGVFDNNVLYDELYKQALAENKKLNNFIANISHDLRTPICVIINTIQLLIMNINNNHTIDDKTNIIKYLNIIKQNAYRSLRMFNSILNVFKYEEGESSLALKNIDIVSLVRSICSSLSCYLVEQNIKLQFVTYLEKKIIAVDPDKIERIILNLLSNSVKFTPRGGNIKITIKEKDNNILISVKDNGLGIQEDKLNVIFERFKQAKNNMKSFYCEGLGLGLSVVKTFTELHNGTIKVKSKINKGTEFIISIPIKNISENISEESELFYDIESNKIIESINVEFSDVYKLN